VSNLTSEKEVIELCERCSARVNLQYKLVEEKNCIYCCGIFSKIKDIAKEMVPKLREYNIKTIEVGCELKGSLREFEDYLNPQVSIKNEIKNEISKILEEFGFSDVRRRKVIPDAVININAENLNYNIRITPIYLYGRYIKRIRNIPQTRWVCSACKGKGCQICGFTGKKYQMSVEEYIGIPIMNVTKCENFILHGAGREDVDTRMLGKGRPFILEIVNPKIRNLNLKELEKAVNEFSKGKVYIKLFGFAEPKHVSELKTGKYKKIYRAVVEFERPVKKEELEEALKNLSYKEINQFTPERVEHRRAKLLRKRRTYKIELLLYRERKAVIKIEADSGLYIKELVSGDKGRTKPSLSEILNNPSRVVKLDVVDVLGGLKEFE